MRFRANRHRAGYPAENKGDCCERSRVLRGKGGFSLLEVLISASILAVGLLGIATIFPVAYLNVDSGGKQTEASAISQSIIEQLRTIGSTNFNGMAGNFPAQGFNNMSTANCQGNVAGAPSGICTAWQSTLNVVNGGLLPQGVGTVTITCQDGAGAVVGCTPSFPTWIATVNVTVNWNNLRGPRTVTLTTRMIRP